MKNYLLKSISLLIVVVFLITSVGFSFGIHHCDSSHENEIFFFEKDHKCKTELEKPKCCCENKVVTESKCCSNSHITVKMNVEYSVQHFTADQKIYFTNYCQDFLDFDFPDYTKQIEGVNLLRPPPNLLVGREIILLYQSIKIPNSLS